MTYSVLVVQADDESKWSTVEVFTWDERILEWSLSCGLYYFVKFDSCELQDITMTFDQQQYGINLHRHAKYLRVKDMLGYWEYTAFFQPVNI